jgi:hypothetical protein
VIRVRVGVEDVSETHAARGKALHVAVDLVQARIDRERGVASFVHDQVGEAALVGLVRLDGERGGGARQRRHRSTLL